MFAHTIATTIDLYICFNIMNIYIYYTYIYIQYIHIYSIYVCVCFVLLFLPGSVESIDSEHNEATSNQKISEALVRLMQGFNMIQCSA